MSFDVQQQSHCALRSIVAEKTRKVVVWTGSGLSAAAGLPTWAQFKACLVAQLREKASAVPANEEKSRSIALRAENEANNWKAFQILKENLGLSTYHATVREALLSSTTVECPEAYRLIWKLAPAGIVNLNLDRLATRALSEVSPGRLPAEFSGRNVNDYIHVLKSPYPFIANLHGVADEASSWVFTQSDLKGLQKSDGYRAFINACFAATTTLFVGISTDDRAVGGHLEALAEAGIDVGPHYWLTDREDSETDEWAERSGIQLIHYDSRENHAEVIEFFEDVLRFVPNEDPSPPPVVFGDSTDKMDNEAERPPSTSSVLPDAGRLLQLHAEEIREILNIHVKEEIMKDASPASYEKYDEFAKSYDQAIYRAWYTSVKSPDNKLLGFTLCEEIARGAFGRVYRAIAPDGQEVAIKVLLEDVRRDPKLLGSFRRGVRSMKYLREREVEGMVAYQKASEIPAFVVMDMIDGPTLSKAVEARQVDDWESILKIATEMTAVIRRAHGIPERVLHRDLRPSNIMFEAFYSQPDNWRVVVLDFDLSWHEGAHEQSVIHGASTGYLAPEQIQIVLGASTRHAAVDSFGVGMTLYYLISGADPLPAQHLHHDWSAVVKRYALRRTCAAWVSLPYRYARLIIRATLHKQADRWDIAQINDELERLREALSTPDRVVSAELLAEEVTARCSSVEYTWDDDKATAVVQLESGLVARISGEETKRQLVVALNWSSSGLQERKRVGKWMRPATERCIAKLKKAGWEISGKNIQAPITISIEATLPVEQAAASLSATAEIISQVVEELTFR